MTSEPRIVISAHKEDAKKELLKLHKKITLWRTKKGGAKPVPMLQWAVEAQAALEGK